jgi:hypothetical protein
MRYRAELQALSLALALLSAGCVSSQPDAAPPTIAGPVTAEPEADADGTAGVSGLALPGTGDVFMIGDDKWEVVAATVELGTEGAEPDEKLIDITVSARKLEVAPAEPVVR